jgi:hypothetical protein
MRLLALIFVGASLMGCTVALGPGFHHADRLVDVSAISIEPAHIHLRVRDTLENVGNRELRNLDVVLPGGPSFGTRDIVVSVDEKPVETQRVNRESGVSLRIPFDPVWTRNREKEISFGYDLEPATEGRGVVAATMDGFYLADPNVFPAWQSPPGPFARSDLRAHAEELDVTVPADFKVLAVGRERHTDRRGPVVTHRFEMLGAEFPPYLIAGRYQERRVETEHGTVLFWTRDALDEETARTAARRIMGTHAAYEQLFGRVTKNRAPVYVVETSADLAAIDEATTNISAASFPEGVLFDHRALSLGLSSGPVLDLADYELARTWFGWHIRPQPGTDLLLGRGIGMFAAVLAAQGRGGAAVRDQQIARLIAAHDRLGPAADEKPGFGPALDYTAEQRTAKSYKAALFLASLEDIAGKEGFDRALRRVLKALSGQEIGDGELRSALEAETGRNLAGVFHAWLDHAGIPADFRARYAGR